MVDYRGESPYSTRRQALDHLAEIRSELADKGETAECSMFRIRPAPNVEDCDECGQPVGKAKSGGAI